MISPWVEQYASRIDASIGPVLDLACGAGRHSEFLQSLGFQVVALDRDELALQTLRSRGFECVSCDLELQHRGSPTYRWPFAANSFAAIVVTNYLHRPLFPVILSSIRPGGVLIYETFAVGNEAYGRPKNPAFLLCENELLHHVVLDAPDGVDFICLGFEHGLVNQSTPAIVQRICAQRK